MLPLSLHICVIPLIQFFNLWFDLQYVKVARNQSGVMELGGNMPQEVEKRFALSPEVEPSIAIPGGDHENENNNNKDEEADTQQSPASAATSR